MHGTVNAIATPGGSDPVGTPGAKQWVLALAPSLLALSWLVTEVNWFWRNRPDLQFGWLVLLLCLYLLWEAGETAPPWRGRVTWTTVLAVVAGFGFLFGFQMYRMAFGATPAAIWFLASGVMLMVG